MFLTLWSLAPSTGHAKNPFFKFITSMRNTDWLNSSSWKKQQQKKNYESQTSDPKYIWKLTSGRRHRFHSFFLNVINNILKFFLSQKNYPIFIEI